jgi:hypothetical protein
MNANIGLPPGEREGLRTGRAVDGSAGELWTGARTGPGPGPRGCRRGKGAGGLEVVPGARSGATQLQFPQLGFA